MQTVHVHGLAKGKSMTPGEFAIAHLAAHGDTGREELAALVQPYCQEGTSAYTALEALRREGLIYSTGDGKLRLGRHPKHARPKNFWGFAV